MMSSAPFYLSSLEDFDDLKEIVIERLGFGAPSIASIDINLTSDLEKKISFKETVGEHKQFKILYFNLDESKKASTQTVDQFLRSTEREIIKKFPKEKRAARLFIFSDRKTSLWHLVHSPSIDSVISLKRFTITPDNRDKLRTASTQLDRLKVKEKDGLKELINKLEEAFSVDAVSKQFYEDFDLVFRDLKSFLIKKNKEAGEKNAHRFVHLLLNRLMFLHFVQKKGVFDNDKDFLNTYWNTYRDHYDGEDVFFEDWLKPLFFEALNNNFHPREYFKLKKEYPDINKIFLQEAPNLNGGLFRTQELDSLGYEILDKQFQNIFEFFGSYNFTIKESTPLDLDLDIDPEMLGNIYEMMVNVSELEDEQHEAGIFFTPKVEIELMLRRSLSEFIHEKTEINKEKIYEYVFPETEEQIVPEFNNDQRRNLLKLLDEITIVDPACGSGHYLVVAAQILWELKNELYKQEGKKVDKFQEKQSIIEQSIFGVDVKDWATEIAKLRLWLDLFVDADVSELRSKDPLLPGLSFKIRVGDSLVQEIGGIYFSPNAAATKDLSPSLRSILNQVKEHKVRYFRNDKYVKENQVKGLEIEFYKAIIEEKINKNKEEINRLKAPLDNEYREQLALIKSGELKPEQLEINLSEESQKRIKLLEEENETLRNQKDRLNLKSKFSFWPIEFAEIFSEKGGFDIVIANPPYVRQEKISDATVDGEQPLKERRKYKEKLETQLQHDWDDPEGKLINLSKKSDLYVYFYLKCLQLLNPEGAMCFISSNSWLDVGYGKNLQEILLKRVPILAIYDNQAKRSFKHADVNTIIALFKAPFENDWANSLKGHKILFVNFKKPFEEVLYSEIFTNLEKEDRRKITDTYQIHPISQEELYKDGVEKDKGKTVQVKYIGNKWGGKYLRAPDIYWKILEKAGDKLVRLGDIAEIRRGFTTGANEFFYVEDVTNQLED